MAVLQRIFNLAEFAKDGLVMLARDADAGVGHREENLIFHHARGNRNLAARRELERVRNQVAQNLRDLAFVRV